jgi:GntR family transcriptional regulator / MocR family aminotransferase
MHEQLEQALRAAIRSGRLAAGTKLPSSRGLSDQLRISRGVVTAAYSQLAAEGYLVSRQGAPVRVSASIQPTAARPAARPLTRPFTYDLRPGIPDLAGFPREGWQRSVAAAWKRVPAGALGEVDPRGTPELRDALASYLDRVRGTASDPELLLVTSGFAQGLSLTCRYLRSFGVERVAVEDPGWHNHRLIVEQAGLTAVPVPVDGDGLDVDALASTDAAVVVVTPAHQFPTGAVLARDRRTALLDWAERGDRLIIEDDYDAELRYDRTPVGSLQGLAPDRVVYAGSASKTLAPGLRLGWFMLPGHLAGPMAAAKITADRGSPALEQLALADLVTRGEFDRHLRRMRPVYRRRRDALLYALARRLPWLEPTGVSAGLHLVTWLPPDLDEATVVAAAARAGVGIDGVAPYRISHPGPGGLIFGYGAASEQDIAEGVAILAGVIGR